MLKTSSRPNFLLFITDQHRADFLGCYGHPVLRTPNIDSIAAHGTAFDRFYVNSPVCQPNRASLMTGRMPSVHDVRSNGICLSMEAVTFADLLADAGYRTALIGKSHLQNFTPHAPIIKRQQPRDGFYEPQPALRQALRDHLDEPKYEQETPEYWTEPGAHACRRNPTHLHGAGRTESVGRVGALLGVEDVVRQVGADLDQQGARKGGDRRSHASSPGRMGDGGPHGDR